MNTTPAQDPAPDPELRAGDPERNSALDRLGAYFADGYLGIDEFEERLYHALETVAGAVTARGGAGESFDQSTGLAGDAR